MTANPDEDDDVDPNAEMYRQWAEEDLRDKESCEAIGEFIHEFSQLEFTIKFLIAKYADLHDDIFHIMLGDVEFIRLCTMLSALVELKLSNDERRRRKLAKLIHEARSINADRVVIAHGMWTSSDFGLIATKVNREKLMPRAHFPTPESIRDAASKAAELMSGLLTAAGSPGETGESDGAENSGHSREPAGSGDGKKGKSDHERKAASKGRGKSG
jgi:hypothetical protein